MFCKEFSTTQVTNPELVGKEVIIWGGGAAGKKVYEKYILSGICKCKCFCDSSVVGVKYGVTIITPEELFKYDKNTPIIIAVNSHLDYVDIALKLREMGFKKCFAERENLYLPTEFDKDEFSAIFEKSKHSINRVYSLLHDNISRTIFENVLSYRITNDQRLARQSFELSKNYEQYFPGKEIFSPGEDEIFIDAGCCDTYTIGQFIKWCHNDYKKVYAFEPSKVQYELCRENQLNNGFKGEIINAGLYSKNSKLYFSAGFNSGTGKIMETGDEEVEVVALDDFLKNKNEKITFIKMDIEGSEMDALLGCKCTIEKYHPKLAISIYHKIVHMWEIPLWIVDNFPGYKLYIRHYSCYDAETIVYARWDERESVF